MLDGDGPWHAPDAYAFGVIMWEILTLRRPWAGLPTVEVWARVQAGERPQLGTLELSRAAQAPFGYIRLMHDMWAQRPQDRPTFKAALGRLQQLMSRVRSLNSV